MNELDRILGNEEELEPSSGLTRRVMQAVERDRQTPPPIPFPWMRLLPALLGALAIVVAFAIYLATAPPDPTPGLDVTRWLDHPLAVPLGGTALSLIFSWVAVRFSMRLAGPAR